LRLGERKKFVKLQISTKAIKTFAKEGTSTFAKETGLDFFMSLVI
jgi:ribosomal protein L28